LTGSYKKVGFHKSLILAPICQKERNLKIAILTLVTSPKEGS
jgi:hypothetical protein